MEELAIFFVGKLLEKYIKEINDCKTIWDMEEFFQRDFDEIKKINIFDFTIRDLYDGLLDFEDFLIEFPIKHSDFFMLIYKDVEILECCMQIQNELGINLFEEPFYLNEVIKVYILKKYGEYTLEEFCIHKDILFRATLLKHDLSEKIHSNKTKIILIRFINQSSFNRNFLKHLLNYVYMYDANVDLNLNIEEIIKSMGKTKIEYLLSLLQEIKINGIRGFLNLVISYLNLRKEKLLEEIGETDKKFKVIDSIMLYDDLFNFFKNNYSYIYAYVMNAQIKYNSYNGNFNLLQNTILSTLEYVFINKAKEILYKI